MNILNNNDNPLPRLLLGAVSISFSGVWVKIADVPPATSAFYRVLFGFLFLLCFSLSTREQWNKNIIFLLMGGLCGLIFVFDLLCWHGSILRVGPGLATLLGNFQVFILAGIGFFFLKERYSHRLLTAIPLALTGLYFIIGVQWPATSESYRYGIYLGWATAVFYAAYILSLKYLSLRSSSSFFPMMLVSFSSAVILALYIYASDGSFVIPSVTSGVSLLALGFLSQFFGWFLIATSLPKVSTSFAGLVLLLQPSLSFIWDVIFFHRPTSPLNWAGVSLALCAIYLGITSRQQKR